MENYLKKTLDAYTQKMKLVSEQNYWNWLERYIESKENHCFNDEEILYLETNQEDKEKGLLLSYFFEYIQQLAYSQSIFSANDDSCDLSFFIKYNNKYYSIWSMSGQGTVTGIEKILPIKDDYCVIVDEEFTPEQKKDAELVEYILVNVDLGMSPGKIAAQVGHVCGMVAEKESNTPKYQSWKNNYDFKKIVLAAHEKTLLKLENQFYAVRDKGYTEIPENSLTAISLGILTRKEAAPYVKRLQILK